MEARQLPGRRSQEGGRVLCTDLELWTEKVEQSVIDNMIVSRSPFWGPPTELESQLQRVKVCAKST